MKTQGGTLAFFTCLAAAAALVLAACAPTASATGRGLSGAPLSGPSVYHAVWRSILCLGETGDCIGTGWVIEPGLAVTAQHVVGTKVTVNIHTAFSGPFPATVIGVDKQHDIALLAFNQALVNAPALPTRSLDLLSELGGPLYALGYGGAETKRDGGAGAPSVRSGVFSQMPDLGARLGANIKTDARGVPGDSGGPLVDSQGNVVGMHRSKDPDGVYSYAVPVEKIREVLPRLKAGVVIP
ncbi:MAG: trypsin-like peptidase domain-containing protein [Chloroflexi bacterium]|nr:trypsin-like peptidase domain-containing protein [Chloroflexota bacterium]